MVNLLEQTLEILKENDRTPNDVEWIGNTKEYSISWREFVKIADIEYDSGHGAAEIAGDLIIVGRGFYMSRGEYDGAEWWEFHTKPKQPENPKPFTKIKGELWDKLKDLNTTKEGES